MPQLLIDLAAGREPQETTLDAAVVALAQEHRLTGLLWDWVRSRDTDPELKFSLAQTDLFVQAHQARVWALLDDVVTRLAEAGIEVATLKGVTAEARWYGRRGERPCSDVDLLLSPTQLHRTGDALALLEPDHPWVPYVTSLATTGRIQSVTTRVNGLEVDVHLDPFKLGVPTRQHAEIWRRMGHHPLPGGGCVRVLDDTTALVQLLVHLNKDRFQRLLGYADIARIIAAGKVDWPRFDALARGEGIEMSVLQTLEVVLDELSIPWPEQLRRARGPRALLWSMIWRPSIRLRGREGRLRFRRRQDWLPYLARGRAIEAFWWWIRRMWPPVAVVAARYADVRGPYLWKLFRGRLNEAQALRSKLGKAQTPAHSR